MCIQAENQLKGIKKHMDSDRIDGTRKSALNAKLHKGNKSGHKGVNWIKSRKKWRAYIGFKGKQIFLGHYENKKDAIVARLKAEEKYYKPYLEDDKNEHK